jgi:hypothetical protein
MFAAGNKKHLAVAIWSFLVCATARAVQLGVGASPSKLNLLYKVHGSVPVVLTMCGPNSSRPGLSRHRFTQTRRQSAVAAVPNKRFA